jgi:hypothetical protein
MKVQWPFPTSSRTIGDPVQARKNELAAEVATIIAHAKSKHTMTGEDDRLARPLIGLLCKHGHIPDADFEGAYIEWQGAWEHDVAAIFFGDDHCLNVTMEGDVHVFN